MDLGEDSDVSDERLLQTQTVENLVVWAWGWLSPQSLARFNVAEMPAGDDCCVSFLDHMFVLRFGPGLRPGANTPPESVIEAITGAFALLEGVAFDRTFLGGMDLEAGRWENIAYYRQLDRHERALTPPDSSETVAMMRAVRVAETARKLPGYRLALRDVLSALLDRGDDAFIFAYRAISDVARALGESGRVDWPALHRHLSTTEEAFRERVGSLQHARDAAAHGDETDVALMLARRNRHGLIKLARQIVADAMIVDDRIALDADAELH
jgi:hypothetical protein